MVYHNVWRKFDQATFSLKFPHPFSEQIIKLYALQIGNIRFFHFGEQIISIIISIIKAIYFYGDVQLLQASKSTHDRGIQSKIYIHGNMWEGTG